MVKTHITSIIHANSPRFFFSHLCWHETGLMFYFLFFYWGFKDVFLNKLISEVILTLNIFFHYIKEFSGYFFIIFGRENFHFFCFACSQHKVHLCFYGSFAKKKVKIEEVSGANMCTAACDHANTVMFVSTHQKHVKKDKWKSQQDQNTPSRRSVTVGFYRRLYHDMTLTACLLPDERCVYKCDIWHFPVKL